MEKQNKTERMRCVFEVGHLWGWSIAIQMNHNHCHLTETTHMLRLTFLHCQMAVDFCYGKEIHACYIQMQITVLFAWIMSGSWAPAMRLAIRQMFTLSSLKVCCYPFNFKCVCICCVLSPCGPLVWYFEEIQGGLLGCLSAASVLELTDISRQERTGRVSRCRPLIAVMLRVSLIGRVICILQPSVLVSNCWGTCKLKMNKCILTEEIRRLGNLMYQEAQVQIVLGCGGATWTCWDGFEWRPA